MAFNFPPPSTASSPTSPFTTRSPTSFNLRNASRGPLFTLSPTNSTPYSDAWLGNPRPPRLETANLGAPKPAGEVAEPAGFEPGLAKKTGGGEIDLKASQHELFNKEKYTDLTVKCKSRLWKCHRAILCPRCPFFEAACGGQFNEASTREIDLSDDDETALGMMLQYLYTYEIFNHGLATATSFQVLIIGDKYEIDELREIGLQNLSNDIANLTSKDAKWVAEWYPQLSQLQQRGTPKLKIQLSNTIAKFARDMIRHDAVRELVANDGALAVQLVEKLAGSGPATFAQSPEWLRPQHPLNPFGGPPGSSSSSSAATFVGKSSPGTTPL